MKVKFDNKNKITVTYWINKLQNLYTKEPILVTLNPPYRNLIDKNNFLSSKLYFGTHLLERKHLVLLNKVKNLQGKT